MLFSALLCSGRAKSACRVGARYVVVSTQGRGDQAALQAALAIDAEYVAFVDSRKKAAALKAALAERGVAPDRLDRLKAPAGLDLGAVTPDKIAISILAEIVAARRALARDGLIGRMTRLSPRYIAIVPTRVEIPF
jgi:xanthine dehydrogenase accessory factor